jgi:nitrogen fixation/metabolism regulation signal transduction histidine kinase
LSINSRLRLGHTGANMPNSSPFFRGSVLAELVSRTLFVGIVILFVYGGFSYYVSKKTFDSEMGARLLTIARLSADQDKWELLPFLNNKGKLYEQFRNFLLEKKKETQAQNLFIMDPDGRVLVDADGQYDFKENNWLCYLDSDPFNNAKAGIPSTSILFPESDGGIYKIGYAPIYKNKKVIAVLGVEASARFISGLNQFARFLFAIGLACLLLMGGLLYAFGRRFISPIEEMAKASQKIAEGDFSQRVKVTSSNELGSLAHAFNEMTKRLQSHNEYILESMSNGLLVVDLNGNITTFNRAASLILEIDQENAIGKPYEIVFSKFPSFFNAIEIAHRKHQHLHDKEVNLSEEAPKFIRLRSAPLLGADSQELGTEVLFTDETQLRKLQSQIKTSEKMATIGELAAGIAHEIRNPLGAMKGFAEILQKKLKSQPEAREMLTDIASEIEILNKIVTNFLIFAKPTSLEPQETELGDAVQGILPLVEKEAEQKKIRVFFHKRKDVFLRLDIDQFRRAVLNLALNAIQASPKNSEIVIEMDGFFRTELINFLSEEGFFETIPSETEGYWGGVWILDQGPGILLENFKKLFTPFFSTKTEGFGLGLSITKKILESLGGTIAAVNRRDGGAMFLMILPAFEKNREEV